MRDDDTTGALGVLLLLGGRGNLPPALLRGVAEIVDPEVDENEGGNLNFFAAVRLRRSREAEGGGKGNFFVLDDRGDRAAIGFMVVATGDAGGVDFFIPTGMMVSVGGPASMDDLGGFEAVRGGAKVATARGGAAVAAGFVGGLAPATAIGGGAAMGDAGMTGGADAPAMVGGPPDTTRGG